MNDTGIEKWFRDLRDETRPFIIEFNGTAGSGMSRFSRHCAPKYLKMK